MSANNISEALMPGIDEKVLALYANGVSTRDIREIAQELGELVDEARPLTRHGSQINSCSVVGFHCVCRMEVS